jgi:hypothetical protein
MLALALALALLTAQADTICTRYESATETVTVCRKASAESERPYRWIYVFVADVRDGWAEVIDCRSDARWTVPAWQVGGSRNIGRNVKIFSRKGA